VEKFFDMTYVAVEKQIKFVAYKLNGGVAAWWDQLQITKKGQGKPPVMTKKVTCDFLCRKSNKWQSILVV